VARHATAPTEDPDPITATTEAAHPEIPIEDLGRSIATGKADRLGHTTAMAGARLVRITATTAADLRARTIATSKVAHPAETISMVLR